MSGSGSGGRLANFVRSPTGLALIVFLAAAGYFLLTEHRAHAIAALPYVLVGGCLLMHFFMHRGHGHGDHGGHDGHETGEAAHGGDHRETAHPGKDRASESTGRFEKSAGMTRRDETQQ